MEIKEIGRMMHILRTSKEISLEDLCRGICSVATLSRLEAGERRPDILEFNALFQRIGKSTDHINTVLTMEEFEYFVKRRNIEISISTKDFQQAEKEIKIMEKELKEKGHPLQRQDIYRMHALLYIHKEKEREAEKYIYKALLETISDFDTLKRDPQQMLHNLWFSESEIQLLLLYVYIRGQLGEGESALLQNISSYIHLKITDEKYQNKQLSGALYLQACLYRKELLWQKCYDCCETAIASEVKNGTISILFQCLEIEMECLENGVLAENGKLRKKQYESLKAVLVEYGEEIPKFPFVFENVSQEKSLIDEVIRFSRMRSEYSQQELSEGICTPETLSRIETGKRNPTVKHFYALMKKTGVNLGYYNTEFEVKRFETLEKISKMKRAVSLKNLKEAEKLLKEIEMEVDMSIITNQQQIEMCRIICDCWSGKITIQDALKWTEEILELSLEKIDGKFVLPYQPMPVEISLLNQMAVYYRKQEKQKQAMEILIPLYEYFHQSKLEAPEHSQRYFMVIGNLAYYLEELDELEKAMELLKESLTSSVKYNIGLRIGSNLIEKGYIQERMGDNSCLKSYEYGYYLCGLLENFINQKHVRKHVWEKWKITYED